jgi:transposase
MRPSSVSSQGFIASTTLSRWTALCRFLDDGRIDLDNNPVERAIRPVALGRKNHLFAGSDGGGARWATVCALITTAKLNDVEPFAYLRDILERMTDGHPMSRLDDPAMELGEKICQSINTCNTATLTGDEGGEGRGPSPPI